MTPTVPRPSPLFLSERRRQERSHAPTEETILPTFGIALSGGGCRSLAASSGLLRGLHSCAVLNKASHISGVSGGGWATMAYTYAQGRSQQEVLIMERSGLSPADLTLSLVKSKPPKTSLLQSSTNYAWPRFLLTLPCSTMRNLLDIFLLRAGPTTLISMDWITTVYESVLGPMGIPSGKEFAQSEQQVERYVANEPHLRKDDFVLPAAYVNYTPCIGITMVGPPEDGHLGTQRHPCTLRSDFYTTARAANDAIYNSHLTPVAAREQFNGISLVSYTVTPSAIFSKYQGPEMDIKAVSHGGGCCEAVHNLDVQQTAVPPYDFAVSRTKQTWCGKRRINFPLEVAAAYGGDPALASATNSGSCINLLASKATGSLSFRTTPNGEPRRLLMGDGGLHENTGTIALLQQGVTDIIMTLNTPTPFDASLAVADPAKCVADDLPTLFGVDLGSGSHTDIYGQNQVFPTEAYTESIIPQFLEAYNSGRALIATLCTKTVANPFYGIPAGLDVDFVVLYLHAPTNFTSQLRSDVAAAKSIQPYNTSGHFPYFHTTFQNPPEPIRMSNVQANLLDALMQWYITSEAGEGGKLHDFIQRQLARNHE